MKFFSAVFFPFFHPITIGHFLPPFLPYSGGDFSFFFLPFLGDEGDESFNSAHWLRSRGGWFFSPLLPSSLFSSSSRRCSGRRIVQVWLFFPSWFSPLKIFFFWIMSMTIFSWTMTTPPAFLLIFPFLLWPRRCPSCHRSGAA